MRIDPAMRVSRRLYARCALVYYWRPLWQWLGTLETSVLADSLTNVAIDRPVYVTGLPRAGSTILLEQLAGSTLLTSHRYSDFPMVFTPYWRNRIAQLLNISPGPLRERAHRDRILVNANSPEAIEEVLWMSGFEDLHTPDVPAVLGASTDNPVFESTYRNHIRKLLLVRQRPRYLAKNNYLITRLGYLLKLFPDARVVVPVRAPLDHVASLVKQGRLFGSSLKNNPRGRRYLRWVGHYEFGPDMVPLRIEPGWSATQRAWAAGDLVEMWARQWHEVYGFLADLMEREPELRRNILVVPYEQLCSSPDTILPGIAEHCQLDEKRFKTELGARAGQLSAPQYYTPDFSSTQRKLIERLCLDIARRFGYTTTASVNAP